MSVTSDDIDKLAVLSRLRFEQDEHADFTAKLGSIVEFVAQLQSIDTDDVSPMAHPLDQAQRLRVDVADANIDRERLQATTNHAEEGLYLVPRVIE
ncbi:MAG: Asp-tRNA(Asn)/Glu-tRNA(Gln) amidotransferase subunit GatC [Pseudomonadota bacterium]